MRFNLGLGLALVGAAWGLPVLAHGVELEHRSVSSLEVQARFDNGEPMANAQVLIYAPGNPTEVWQQGTTDDQGRFSFVPDNSLPGNWEVMVRQAGHGGVTTIPIASDAAASATAEAGTDGADSANDSAAASGSTAEPELSTSSVLSPSTSLSPVQRGITIGAIIWGFIGTALFFARGKR